MRRLALVLMLLAAPALAVEPDEILSDPALEERARQIGGTLRCVVCASEPIESSRAGMARDMRILVRERLEAGDTDAEVYAYMTARYGDFVLFRPPFKPSTWALWTLPFVLIGGIAVGGAVALRRRAVPAAPPPLTEAERAELDRLG